MRGTSRRPRRDPTRTSAQSSSDPQAARRRAAQAKHRAGAFDAALELLAAAEAGPLGELQRARADLLRGQIAFTSSRGSDAPLLLLKAAKRFELLDVGLACETYLEALSAAAYAARFVTGDVLRQTAAPWASGMEAGVPARDLADANVLVPGGLFWPAMNR